MIPNALELFRECLQHPEELMDEFYGHDEMVVSSSRDDAQTQIMRVWSEVLERITAAKIAQQDGENDTFERCVSRLDELLKDNEHANLLEFPSFFPVVDVSFSIYKGLDDEERLTFLGNMLSVYIEKRHSVYTSHGYSPATIQVRKDFEKHKSQGNFAFKKIESMCLQNRYRQGRPGGAVKVFCSLDTEECRNALGVIAGRNDIWYSRWSKDHQGKHADMLISSGGHHFIVEAKHVKEGGGGQDKQITELISLISNAEHQDDMDNIHYVAFLDGIYFNELIGPSLKPKAARQKAQIEGCLRSGDGRNFFVNTYGLKTLLENI